MRSPVKRLHESGPCGRSTQNETCIGHALHADVTARLETGRGPAPSSDLTAGSGMPARERVLAARTHFHGASQVWDRFSAGSR